MSPLQPTSDSLDTRSTVAYAWEYASTRPELRALYEKSKNLMWNAHELAWDTAVDPEAENLPDSAMGVFHTPLWGRLDQKRDVPKLRQHMLSYFISNFLHGEQGALLAASQIVAAAPTADAKLYAAAQVFDEARHVEVYDKYLRDKIELTYPPSPHLRTLLDWILTDSRWDFKYLGMQVMVEGLALGAFGLVHRICKEPLINQITEYIMRDEARHVAFGVMTLKGFYGDMPASELRDREEFIIEASRLLHERFLAQEVWAHVGLPQEEAEEAVRNSATFSMFRALLFRKIVPNIKRLGLLTPTVRSAFRDLQVLQFEDEELGE